MKKYLVALVPIALAISFASTAYALQPGETVQVTAGGNTTDIYANASSTVLTWTAPTGVTSITVEAYGGGAGKAVGGGGGGGGGYAKKSISVTPGNGYSLEPGLGGQYGNSGHDSWFSTSTVVDGQGGSKWNGSAAAGGGYVGDSGYTGGNGGGSAFTGTAGGGYGGGAYSATYTGGGGAGNGTNGNSGGGGGNNGGAGGGTYLGYGGANGAGDNGGKFGGGGGGGDAAGAGGDGAVYITYTTPAVPTVTSPTSASVTDTTATLGGNVTSVGSASLSAEGITWGTSANPRGNVVTSGSTAGGVFTVPVTGLPQNTLIYFDAYATNNVGTTYSSDGTFTTLTSITGIGATTGTQQVGYMLTAGSVSPGGATVSYQWQEATTAGGSYSPISGATNSTYTTQSGNLGYYIEVVVIGTGSYAGTATSAPVGPIQIALTGIGAITGTLTPGAVLTAGSLTPSASTVTYQWQKSFSSGGTYTPISGATASTYTLEIADLFQYIEVVATATGNYTGTVTSAYVGVVLPSSKHKIISIP